MVDSAEELLAAPEIQFLQLLLVFCKIPSPAVAVPNRVPVIAGPVEIRHFRLVNPLVVLPLHLDRNREPYRAVRGFDFVPVPPVPTGVLNVVRQNEFIRPVDEVEVPLPGDVVRLEDGNDLSQVTLRLNPPRPQL